MILIGTDDGIYRWFEGAGWPVFHSLQGRSIVGLTAPGAGVLVALDRAGTVLESGNNGQDWRTIPVAEGAGAPTTLAAWGDPPLIILASRPLGLWRRSIGAPIPVSPEPRSAAPALLGRAWSIAESATGLLAPRRSSARADRPTASRAVWIRLGSPPIGKPAGGKGANNKSERGQGQGSEIRALAMGTGVNERSASPWYAAVKGAGLWRSTDAGGSWHQCTGLAATEVQAIRVVPERPGSVYVATSDGCWLSTDAGQTWEERSGGLDQTRYISAIEVKPGAPDILLAGAAPQGPTSATATGLGMKSSLFESKDGGKSWSLVRRGNPEVLENDTITDLRHDPAAPDNVIMALASGELWTTPNAGAFWLPLARRIRAARTLCAID